MIFTNETIATGPLTDTELRATPVPITGTVTATPTGTQDVNLVSTISVPVTGPLTDTQLRATPVPISGSVSTTPLSASSSTVTQITSVIGNQTLLASNASRKKAILYVTSGVWHIKFGAGASATSRTYFVNNVATTIEVTVWTGIIDGFCTQTGKLVDVTELS